MLARLSVFLLIFCFIFSVGLSYAQDNDSEDPVAADTSKPNVGILDEKPIVEIVEGVGMVLFSKVAFRDAPSIDGNLVRYASVGEKVILLGEKGDWLKVRMYNDAEAYINKKYVRINKVAIDEKVIGQGMDKKMSFIIADILDRFNDTVKKSQFAKKFKIMPYINVVDERAVKGKMTLTFIYSCVDSDNKMVPSYNKNPIQKEMIQLFEILFGKILLTNANSFNFEIKVPVFDKTGKVNDDFKVYANINLDSKDVDMNVIRHDEAKIWNYAKPSIPLDKLFESYP